MSVSILSTGSIKYESYFIMTGKTGVKPTKAPVLNSDNFSSFC